MDATQLGRYPVSINIPVAWGDMDALGHVNNVVYLRWFESGRVAYFDRLGITGQVAGVGPILARQEIDYRLPLTYPDTVRVETSITKLGNTSFEMGFRIVSGKTQALASEGRGVCVMFDYTAGRKVPLPDALRRTVHALEAG